MLDYKKRHGGSGDKQKARTESAWNGHVVRVISAELPDSSRAIYCGRKASRCRHGREAKCSLWTARHACDEAPSSHQCTAGSQTRPHRSLTSRKRGFFLV